MRTSPLALTAKDSCRRSNRRALRPELPTLPTICTTGTTRTRLLFKTTDFGKTWTNITSNLPAWGNTYVVREDPRNPRVLYVGTEGGLFVSIDGGARWLRWKGDLPHTGVRSLAVQARERELVVGTFGRAIWIADIGPLAQLEEAMRQRVFFFDVKPAVAHNIRYIYGSGVEEINGDLFFRAKNPPYGTLLSYLLRDAVPGEAPARREELLRTPGPVIEGTVDGRSASRAMGSGNRRSKSNPARGVFRHGLRAPAPAARRSPGRIK